MMKSIAAFILTASTTACTTSVHHRHSEIGFRGINLGSPPRTNMVPLEEKFSQLGIITQEVTNSYRIPNERNDLGQMKIKAVTYEYIDKKLFKIHIDLRTENQKKCPNVIEIISALESQYSIKLKKWKEDYVNNDFLYQWRSPDAWITYMCLSWTETNSIFIEQPELREEIQERLNKIKQKIESQEINDIKKSL
jgi:hypothetical protein